MSIFVSLFRYFIGKSDKKRNDAAPKIEGVKRVIFPDFNHDKNCSLALYLPLKRIASSLPILVIVHGGAWIYGNIETYDPYARYLSSKGFAVVSFDYPLAPEYKFPLPISFMDKAILFLKEHQKEYDFDLENIFLVGDSAGASMALQYALASRNHAYGIYFSCAYPLSIKGLLLNCGTYIGYADKKEDFLTRFIAKQCLPPRFDKNDPRYNPLHFLEKKYCPRIFLMTSDGDFLREETIYLHNLLSSLKITHEHRDYQGSKRKLPHVFHCDFRLKEAYLANDEECEWVRKNLK